MRHVNSETFQVGLVGGWQWIGVREWGLEILRKPGLGTCETGMGFTEWGRVGVGWRRRVGVRLVDFSRTNGFGDTIEAVKKAARVLGLKIREDLEAWESEGGL